MYKWLTFTHHEKATYESKVKQLCKWMALTTNLKGMVFKYQRQVFYPLRGQGANVSQNYADMTSHIPSVIEGSSCSHVTLLRGKVF